MRASKWCRSVSVLTHPRRVVPPTATIKATVDAEEVGIASVKGKHDGKIDHHHEDDADAEPFQHRVAMTLARAPDPMVVRQVQ